MRIKCIDNSAAMLPKHYHSRFVPKASPTLKFPLEIGKEYIVGGVGMFIGGTAYLVQTDREACPDFLPAPLFQVLDGTISRQWRFWASSQFHEFYVECILGYPELTDGSNHLDELVDGNRDAVRLFARRLQEIEDELRYFCRKGGSVSN